MKISEEIKNDWAMTSLDDLLDYVQPTKYIVESTEYHESYKTPVLTAGKSFIIGYTNETKGIFDSLPTIIFDDFTTATKFVNFPFKVKSSAMKILTPKNSTVNIKYVYYLMQTIRISFDTHKRYWISEYSKFKIPVPSPSRQHSIVSKIEELFSELDKSIENLRTAQQQLKTYRQAVLKWAFEGKLTEEWRKKNGAQVRVPTEDRSKDVKGALPDGWEIKRLNEIGTWRGGGTPSKARNDFWEDGNILWVSPKDMKSKLIHDTIDKITLDAIENSSTKLIPKGSVLFVVRSGILRRTLPVALTITDVTVNQDIQAFTPYAVLPDYVYWFIKGKSEEIRRECSKGGTTVESIESSLLKNYTIPISSPEEQCLIVQEIETRLSVTDKIEETITQSLQQAEALRQSILKKAFEGKLV